MLLLMNPQKNPQGPCHRYHLFPGSRIQELEGTLKCFAGCFPKIAKATTAETVKSLLSLIVGIGCMKCLTFCSKWTLWRRMYRSLYPVRKVASQRTSPLGVCQKLSVYDHHLPITVPLYDISSEGQSRLDEVPIEVAPCDNSNDVDPAMLDPKTMHDA